MTNYVPARPLWHSENWTVKINEIYDKFLLLKDNILSIQSVLLFLPYYGTQTQVSFSISLLSTVLKSLEKWAVQVILLNICLSACKKLPNVYKIPYIVLSVYIKICKNCNSMHIIIFHKTNCCLTMHNLVSLKRRTEFLWEILF